MLEYKEYVYAVYKEKGFSKAAQKLFVSQPWLSSAVKKAEQQLKTPLFDRSTTPISLTEAGRYYIDHVEKIMELEEEIEQYCKELQTSAGTELRFGSSMFFCTYVLPSLLADFRLLYPNVTLIFSEGSHKHLKDNLIDGTLDFVLEAEQLTDDKIHSLSWATEELVLAVPAHYRINDHLSDYRYTFDEFLRRHEPNAQKPTVPLQEFSKESFLFLKEGNDSYSRSIRMCENAGFTPNVSAYLSQMMTAYYLVCEGRGIAFLRSTIPEYVMPVNQVVFYQLEDPLAKRHIYLSWSKKRGSPMRQHLIDFMKMDIFLEQTHIKP